jgi:hypothetical protein
VLIGLSLVLVRAFLWLRRTPSDSALRSGMSRRTRAAAVIAAVVLVLAGGTVLRALTT